MQLSTVLGLFIGIGGIIVGNILEGGHISSLIQAAAAFVVFGGTFGALLVANRFEDIRRGLELLKLAFMSPGQNLKKKSRRSDRRGRPACPPRIDFGSGNPLKYICHASYAKCFSLPH